MSPSCPYHSVAVLATTMLWASIILPITPPQLFAAPISTGETPICCAEIFCRLPKSTFEDVSDPVRATPNHPSRVPKKGYRCPVRANARPMVASTPEYRVRIPSESIAAMVSSEKRTFHTVCHQITNIFPIGTPITKPEMIAAIRIPVPVADTQLNANTAPSLVGLGTTGGTRCTRLLTPAMGIFGDVIALAGVFHVARDVNTFSGVSKMRLPVWVPHRKTMQLRTSQGTHARTTSPRL